MDDKKGRTSRKSKDADDVVIGGKELGATGAKIETKRKEWMLEVIDVNDENYRGFFSFDEVRRLHVRQVIHSFRDAYANTDPDVREFCEKYEKIADFLSELSEYKSEFPLRKTAYIADKLLNNPDILKDIARMNYLKGLLVDKKYRDHFSKKNPKDPDRFDLLDFQLIKVVQWIPRLKLLMVDFKNVKDETILNDVRIEKQKGEDPVEAVKTNVRMLLEKCGEIGRRFNEAQRSVEVEVMCKQLLMLKKSERQKPFDELASQPLSVIVEAISNLIKSDPDNKARYVKMFMVLFDKKVEIKSPEVEALRKNHGLFLKIARASDVVRDKLNGHYKYNVVPLVSLLMKSGGITQKDCAQIENYTLDEVVENMVTALKEYDKPHDPVREQRYVTNLIIVLKNSKFGEELKRNPRAFDALRAMSTYAAEQLDKHYPITTPKGSPRVTPAGSDSESSASSSRSSSRTPSPREEAKLEGELRSLFQRESKRTEEIAQVLKKGADSPAVGRRQLPPSPLPRTSSPAVSPAGGSQPGTPSTSRKPARAVPLTPPQAQTGSQPGTPVVPRKESTGTTDKPPVPTRDRASGRTEDPPMPTRRAPTRKSE
ncbi:MAG TPA: hypothetical protein VGV92_05250 [Gammaproteobacteria bacterium]|nr:hypothetical protein [Gammaproteobacteria bacterium]